MDATLPINEPEPPPRVAVAERGVPLRGMTWKRFAIMLVLLHLPLLFHGCEKQYIHLTAGLVVPFAKVQLCGDKPCQPVVLVWWSSAALVANVALLAAGLLVACRRWAWAGRLIRSRWFVTQLVFLAVLYDSVWYLPTAWLYGVFYGTSYVVAGVGWLLACGGHPHGTTEVLSVAVGARLYYAACVIVPVLAALGLRQYLRRYFFVAADRWWQVRLSGLITAMLVLGAGIGLLVRVLLVLGE